MQPYSWHVECDCEKDVSHAIGLGSLSDQKLQDLTTTYTGRSKNCQLGMTLLLAEENRVHGDRDLQYNTVTFFCKDN